MIESQFKTTLSIIIPCYCEGENLGILLPRIQRVLENLNISFEILIVDTIKPLDHTQEICKQFKQVLYINRFFQNTYGQAIRTGIKMSKGEYIIFMDADGSHAPEFIPKLFERKSEADIIIASRYIEGGYTDNQKILIFMSWLVNFIYANVLGIKCKDVSNSFKLYKSNIIKSINLTCNNFDIVEEIIYKIIKSNNTITILEIPFAFQKRLFGKTKRNLFIFILTYLITLLKLKYKK